jgi:hypothetical protein
MQSVLFESNFFCRHGNDNSTIRSATSNGTRCFIAAVRKIQRHRSSHGSGIFEPEPFQPGFSRHFRMLPRALSNTNANPEIFAETEAIAGWGASAPKGLEGTAEGNSIFFTHSGTVGNTARIVQKNTAGSLCYTGFSDCRAILRAISEVIAVHQQWRRNSVL